MSYSRHTECIINKIGACEKVKNVLNILLVGVIATSVLIVPGVSKAAGSTFKDVPANHWAKNSIDYAVSKGYFKGYNGSFRPNAEVNRAEFAALLARVSINLSEQKDSFKDLKGHWSENEVTKAIGKGFISTSDYPAGFKPSTPITRMEMSKWIASGLSIKDADFKQAMEDTRDTLLPVAEYFKGGITKSDYPSISIVLGTGLLAGYPDGTFGPGKTTTRAEAAVIIQRLESVQGKEADSFQGLNELREVGTTGTNLTSATPYRYKDNSDIKRILNKNISLRNGVGKVQLHRMIFMNVKKWNDINSIYGPMFVDKTSKRPLVNDQYDVYIDVSVTPSTDNFKYEHFTNGGKSRLEAGFRIGGNVTNVYGYKSLPSNGDPTFYRKNKASKFWARTSIDNHVKQGESVGYTITTDDGMGALIYLKGEK